jgi:hypothetical protein
MLAFVLAKILIFQVLFTGIIPKRSEPLQWSEKVSVRRILRLIWHRFHASPGFRLRNAFNMLICNDLKLEHAVNHSMFAASGNPSDCSGC